MQAEKMPQKSPAKNPPKHNVVIQQKKSTESIQHIFLIGSVDIQIFTTTASSVMTEYKNIIKKSKEDIINNLMYLEQVFKNDKNVEEIMKLLADQRYKTLLYLINKYGLLDRLVVIKVKVAFAFASVNSYDDENIYLLQSWSKPWLELKS